MTEQRPTDPPPVIAYARPTLAPPPPSRSAKAAQLSGQVGILSIPVGFIIAVLSNSSVVMIVSVVIGAACSLAAIVMGLRALIGRHHGRRQAISGIGLGVFPILVAGCAALILVPKMNAARAVAIQAVCMSHLNEIGRGVVLYQDNNQNAAPPDLATMATLTLVKGPSLKCPGVKGGPACDYFYYRPSVTAGFLRSSTIVACDFKRNHAGQGRAVLYAAGNVAWIGEPAFQAALALPENVEFAKALRTAEGP